ncbi:MAG: hypothetical protein EA417_19660 [Gammaproteobacteria bacterium]|nr:MAG: hypothetical protein EA417_19660 [Gammaproteobacteria bacterium]
MSDDDRKQPPDANTAPPGKRRKLLDDLESIRDLLDAERSGMEIPILREIIPAATPAAQPSTTGEETRPVRSAEEIQRDLFDARQFADRLFDASWQRRSDAILAAARERADELAACIDPEVDAELLAQLHGRVDAELPPALEQVVTETLDDLQDRLLEVLQTELTRLVDSTFGDPGAEPSQD